jgi:hypothetical protein
MNSSSQLRDVQTTTTFSTPLMILFIHILTDVMCNCLSATWC